MKHISTLALLLLAVTPLFAQPGVESLPTVAVTGTAEIAVVPDEVSFTTKVEKISKTLSEAKRQNDEAVAKLLTISKKYVTDSKDIKTDYLSVSEHYERKKLARDDDTTTSVFAGYKVSRTMVIKVRDVTRFEAALSDFVGAGVSNISGVVFATSRLRQYKDEARANAMVAAKEKAAALAGRIGQKIGRAVSIIEKDIGSYQSPSSNSSRNSFSVDGDDPQNAEGIGTISIKAQVEVRFILE
jgi:uncharacterized protein